RSHERIAADRIARKVLAFLGVLLGWNRLRRDVLVREHAVDRTPIGVLDDSVAIVLVRLRLGGATDHLADGVDLDIAAEVFRRALDLVDLLGIALEPSSGARGRPEKRIAVAQCKVLADLRRPGVHEDRPRLAVRLGMGARPLELEELSLKIEIAAFRPGLLDHVEPFLGESITRIVLALRHAEHLEFPLIPADHEIDAETSLADV